MASNFSDISGNSPVKEYENHFKKRSEPARRIKLLPLSELSSPGVYEFVPSKTMVNKMKKITHKRELVEAVRKANTPIMLPGRETGSKRSLQEDTGSSVMLELNAGQRDIEYLEGGVHLNARKFNELKLMVDRRQRELHSLLDELRVLQLEHETLSKIQNQDTPVSKRNNRIKQEIAQCTAGMEEQMHSRRQLEHMIRRLQTTQLRVDAQLTGMTTAVNNSEREVEEVQLLCRQLEVGKSRAVQFLQDVQLQIQVERKARARDLGDHEVRARNSQKMETWRLQRIKERDEMLAELRGDLSAEEESRMLLNIRKREHASEALNAANLIKAQKFADFEALLDEIKLTTGAASLTDVVEKINAQVATSVSLDKEKLEAEERLLVSRRNKELMYKELNELKASYVGNLNLDRDLYSSLENEIRQAKVTLRVNKSAVDHLNGVMSAIRQEFSGLAKRLQPFDDILEGGHCRVVEETSNDTDYDNMIPVSSQSSFGTNSLTMIELKLTKIFEIVGQSILSVNSLSEYATAFTNDDAGDENTRNNLAEEDASVNLLEDDNAMWSPIANSDLHLHKNNIRVRPAGQNGVTLAISTEGQNSARTEASAGKINLGEEICGSVLSRDILKQTSSRHYTDVMRKKELAERRKVASERGISDEEMMAKLRKRNQVETITRLATSPLRHGAQVFLARAASGIKDVAVGSTSVSSLAIATQMQFSDL